MKKKIIVIHQPNLFPTIKILNKIVSGDELVILDDVQFVKNDIQNRIKFRNFKNPSKYFWVTASVKKGSSRKKINDVQFFSYEKFKEEFMRNFDSTYKKSPFYPFLLNYLTECFSEKFENISKFNNHCLMLLMEQLNIDIKWHLSSDVALPSTCKSDDRLIYLTNYYKGKSYLSGLGGRNYINSTKFDKAGIQLMYHPWEKPKDSDIEDWDKVSFIDYIARYGKESLKKYIEEKRTYFDNFEQK